MNGALEGELADEIQNIEGFGRRRSN